MISNKNFPFKLCTTSFIYPDHIIPNVKQLGRHFDEIELLIFESRPDAVLPSKDELKTLVTLSKELSVSYNVHLPVDVSITGSSILDRQKGIDTIKKVVALTSELSPSTHTLHLDFNSDSIHPSEYDIKKWQETTCESLEKLLSSGISPELISVETLEYPFEYLSGILDEFGLSVCVDAGHLIKCGFSTTTVFQRYASKIPLVHFHGVDFSCNPPKDHVSLDKTPIKKMESILNILKEFKGVVSLEVFNYNHLAASLAFMESIQWNLGDPDCQ